MLARLGPKVQNREFLGGKLGGVEIHRLADRHAVEDRLVAAEIGAQVAFNNSRNGSLRFTSSGISIHASSGVGAEGKLRLVVQLRQFLRAGMAAAVVLGVGEILGVDAHPLDARQPSLCGRRRRASKVDSPV